MKKQNQKHLTREIIDSAYKLLTAKLANGGLSTRNTTAVQMEVGYILKTLDHTYEFGQ